MAFAIFSGLECVTSLNGGVMATIVACAVHTIGLMKVNHSVNYWRYIGALYTRILCIHFVLAIHWRAVYSYIVHSLAINVEYVSPRNVGSALRVSRI